MLEAAELGLPEAQGEMAERFYYGQGGVDKDMVLCVEWARRAAQAGDSVGEFRIASDEVCRPIAPSSGDWASLRLYVFRRVPGFHKPPKSRDGVR